MGTGIPTKLGILLAPLRDGTLLGNRCLSTLSTALTHILSLFWQRYPYLNAPLQVGLVGLW